MTTKWTPGPWEYRAQGNCIGQVNGPFIIGCNDTRIANIPVLVAAPKLYEALHKLLEVSEAQGVEGLAPSGVKWAEEAQEAARAALAKARGE